ncbi:MliC family protein [Nitratireductor kimnyeongensis]|uniref:MliC family protein n=1 Tax=Nitratireductor kimnyeongensis TaxID=430679 RepID=A0ABW0TCV5_9HYPH|nr:MliC family protein [Nitratireductor kimnyeongensis]QZZ37187.1 MliC family protein [Nitratireductor kimnyeongensis]
MPRPILSLIALLAIFSQAHAATMEIDLPDAESVEAAAVTYACPGGDIDVTYYNAGDTSLAVAMIDGTSVVMSNVLAASGAKYAGGPYVWWTKGDDADLYDLMKGEGAEPVSCSTKN